MSIVRWRGLPSRTTSRRTRPPALPDSIASSSQSARLRVSWPSSFSITSSLLTPAAAAGLPSIAATTTGKPKRRARTIPVSTTSFFCLRGLPGREGRHLLGRDVLGERVERLGHARERPGEERLELDRLDVVGPHEPEDLREEAERAVEGVVALLPSRPRPCRGGPRRGSGGGTRRRRGRGRGTYSRPG